MNKRKTIVLILCALLWTGVGCAKMKEPPAAIRYYTLEYPSPSLGERDPLPVVLRVERFGVAPDYNTDRILYREASYGRAEYFYHKWRTNPGDMVTFFLRRDIQNAGLFEAVLPSDSRFPSSFSLEGSVDEFLERATRDVWEASLSLSVALMAENEPDITRRVLFQKVYGARKICSQKNPAGLAEAMSLAMAEVSERILQDVYEAIQKRKGQGPGGE